MMHNRRGLAIAALALSLGVITFLLVHYVPAASGARIGDRAPDFRLVRIADGDSIGVRSSYAGHVTLVNIWATWCVPCQQEMPSLQRLYQTYRGHGFRVAAVSIDNGDAAPVRAFVQAHGLTFDILQDRSGNIEDAYQTVAVPESFLLDRHGRITYIVLGGQDWDSPTNRQRIARLIDMGD
jgi:peroxiredoxin